MAGTPAESGVPGPDLREFRGEGYEICCTRGLRPSLGPSPVLT